MKILIIMFLLLCITLFTQSFKVVETQLYEFEPMKIKPRIQYYEFKPFTIKGGNNEQRPKIWKKAISRI